LLLVLSIASANFGKGGNKISYEQVYSHIQKLTDIGEHNYLNPSARDGARDYILQTLRDIGINEYTYEVEDENLDTETYSRVDYIDAQPTFVLQRARINQSTNNKTESTDDTVFVDTVQNNIIVAFPSQSTKLGQRSSNSVVFNTSYDTPINKNGAMSANADTAMMLETIKWLKDSQTQSANDLIFIFGENYQTNLSLQLYANQFLGFRVAHSRTKLAIGIFGYGTTGDAQLYQTSGDNLKLLQKLALGGTGSNSFALQLYKDSKYDTGVYSVGFSYANYGNFGDSTYSKSPLDTVDGVSKNTIESKASLLKKSIEKFKDSNLNALNSDTDGAYFGYLGLKVVLPTLVLIVLGVLILMLAILAVILLVRNRHMTFKRFVNSVFASLLSLFGVGAGILAFYYVFGLWFLVGFGVMPVSALNTFVFANPALVIMLFILVFVFYNAFVSPFKKMFGVKSSEIVRANVVILAVVSAVLAFVLPTFAYPFVIVSLLQTIAMLSVAIFKNKFKNKYSYDIERLFLYFLPVIICLPIVVPAVIATATFVAMPYYALVGTVLALMFGSIIPYFGMLKPKFDGLFARLPKYKVRLVSEEIVRMEDDVKKGRFVNKKQRVISTEKRTFRYSNFVLTLVLTIVASIVFALGASPARNFGADIDSLVYPIIYDNAMVLVHEEVGGATNINWEIKDKNTYNIVNQAVGGFSYDGNIDSYTLAINDTKNLRPTTKTNGTNSVTYNLDPSMRDVSQIEIVAKDASGIEKFTFTASGTEYVYDNVNRKDTIKFNLPYNFGNSSTIEVSTQGDGTVKYEFTQYVYETNVLNNYTEWTDLASHINDLDMRDRLAGGIIFRIID